MTVPDGALAELAELSALVLAQTDLPATMVEICRIAVRSVPGAQGASVTTFSDGRPSALSSDDWALELDELQFEEHEGPCLDAYRTGTLFRIKDLTAEARWPSYVPRAVAVGARSMMSVPLTAQGNLVGALNVYSREAAAFDATATSVAQIVAAHAGVASEVSAAFFRHRDLAEQMVEAMQSRAVIEQAKGVVMALRQCDADGAFEALTELSQTSHRKLRDVAQELVDKSARGEL